MQTTFGDIFCILVKWRKFIILNLILFVLVSAIVALILPVEYTSTGTILPPQEEAGIELGFLSMLTDLPVGIPSLPGFVRPGELYLALLRSRSVRDSVIQRLDLMEYFGTQYMTDALTKLAGITNFDLTEENILVIQATDRTPEFSRKIVTTYMEMLDRVNQKIKKTSAQNFREFLEKRLAEADDDLKQAAERVRNFQMDHKIIALEEQTRTAIEMAAKLMAEIQMKEVELHLAEKNLDPTHATVVQLKSQLVEFEKQLDKLEIGAGLNSEDYIIPFSEVPDLAMQYAFLTKDLEVLKAIYTLLTQQFEQAKIQEKKDIPTLRVLDLPNLPDKKSKPQRRLIVMAAALLSFFVSLFVIFFVEYLNRLKNTDTDRYEKIVQSWRSILADLRLTKKDR
ncbi:MAG: GNVR domain-containing protein [bacterium]